ncbi:hypothetical protein [Sphingopyxis sp.]|jgi:hypothetical protein|uniref:hypothetical protein n=1 Tax=Sphingopyxis sp. TaxID=1908224 RepID=UPI002DF3710E|nr:hypothetical protein [Sphingopyxis sp.]
MSDTVFISNIISNNIDGIEFCYYDTFFERLRINFPFYGTQINYDLLKNLRICDSDYIDEKLCISFINEILDDGLIAGESVCSGDACTEGVIKCNVNKISNLLPDLLSYPQYYYISSPDFDWIIVITMRLIAFGFSPVVHIQ